MIQFISDNGAEIAWAVMGVLSLASSVFEMAGMTKTSKVIGTLPVVDGGRITRYAKLFIALMKATGR
jgi:hypothetical protein